MYFYLYLGWATPSVGEGRAIVYVYISYPSHLACVQCSTFNACPSPYLITCGEHSGACALCTLLPVNQGRDDELNGTRPRTIYLLDEAPDKMLSGMRGHIQRLQMSRPFLTLAENDTTK